MAQENITPGSAPLLWSSIDEAFQKINNNFTELYLSVGGSGTPVDLTGLQTDLIPDISGAYDLGSFTKRWKDIYLTGTSIDLGGARITSPDGNIVELPEGSTVGGALIRNPVESSFKNIAVSGEDTVVADDFTGTVNFAGVSIDITTDATTDTVTFTNAGVTELIGTSGQIGVSGATGSITLTNEGVIQLVGTTGQIGVSGDGTGTVTITNLGVTKITASTGISVSASGPSGTGEITITNSLPASPTFRNIAVTGGTLPQTTVEADNINDTLTLINGYGLTLTTDATNDRITFEVNRSIDINGSVFADDSTVMVDAVDNRLFANQVITPELSSSGSITISTPDNIFLDVTSGSIVATTNLFDIVGPLTVSGTITGNVTGNLTGYQTGDMTGSVFADDSTKLVDAVEGLIVGNIDTGRLRTSETKIALGTSAGATDQGADTVAVGNLAGRTNQGSSAVAIGALSGVTDQGGFATAVGSGAGNTGQGLFATAVGYGAGQTNQGTTAVAVGASAGGTNQGQYAVAIGINAGGSNQGERSVAIGYNAGNGGTTAGSIIINAEATTLTSEAAGFYVAPVRNVSSGKILTYNTTTKEITYTDDLGYFKGNFNGSVFADDSTVLVDAVDGILRGTLQGRVEGTLDGDVTGSVFADDSTLMVDATGNSVTANTVNMTTGFATRITLDKLVLEPLNAAPSTVESAEGMLTVANGVGWNPAGDGTRQLMIYVDSVWRRVSLV